MEHLAVYPEDVYSITEKGQAELGRGATVLPVRALDLMVLMDGKSSVREIVARSKLVSQLEAEDIIPVLIRDGLVEPASIAVQEGLDFSYFFDAEKTTPSAEALANAHLEAEDSAAALARDRYYVSIARRSSLVKRPAEGAPIAVLTVEDDASMSHLLQLMLLKEGFEVRSAKNRAEVVAEMRRLPSPDLVLLDVVLPDANGFDILERIKQHPLLKAIPVIMVTGEATRDNVVRGLADGADGYITKPFDVAILRNAVRYVLGLA
jgi:two-component system OmpR family response regulator